MVKHDRSFPPKKPSHRFDCPPRLVCLPCGKAIFGPITRPFDLLENQECDVCAQPTPVVEASTFRDYDEMFSRR